MVQKVLQWEILKEDSVLKVQRDLHFALSDNEEAKRDRISPFRVFKLRKTPVFVSSRCVNFNVKQINLTHATAK